MTWRGVLEVLVLLSMAMPLIAQPLLGTPQSAPAPPKVPLEKQRYEDRYTFKYHQVHRSDPYVWVYVREFAEQFRMPKQWIDADLKGALGIAWRMTSNTNTMCGLSGRADNCMEALTCQMDIYFDNRVKLPWNSPELVRDVNWPELTSTQFLYTSKESYFNRYKSQSFGIMNSGGELRHGASKKGFSFLSLYDREFEPGIGVMTWVGDGVCPGYVGPEKVYMKFITASHAEARSRGSMRYDDIPAMHVIEFPQTFLRRANGVYLLKDRPNQEKKQELMRLFYESQGSIIK